METEYNTWLINPTPQNMSILLETLGPALTSEIHRYPGSKALLRGQAKLLAIKAIKSYSPDKGTALKSWVTSQLQPLYRYSHKLRPINISEANAHKAAEIYNVTNKLTQEFGRTPTDGELADYIGIPAKKINFIRTQVKPVMIESNIVSDTEDATEFAPPVNTVSTLGLAKDVVHSTLDPRQRMVFEHKTGHKGKPILTNIEIAKRLGVTPSMVTQMSNDISNKLVEVNANVI